MDFRHEYLRPRAAAKADGVNYVHNNPDVWAVLNRLRPKVVITTGFNPTHLYAFAWSKLHRARHLCMTDGTLQSEARLGSVHRLLRTIVFRHSDAFIAASQSGRALYGRYGIPEERIFQSPLCADNARFARVIRKGTDREFDVMFSGQFHERKLPFLFVESCQLIKARRGRCRALLIGDGPLRDEVLRRLCAAAIEFEYPGFVRQADLPGWYCQARVLLFTTRMDPWGVVANEAMAAGTPVITTPYAGVAGELVLDGKTGFVRAPVAEEWANAAMLLLDDPARWVAYSAAGRKLVEEYNYEAAANGIRAACRHAVGDR